MICVSGLTQCAALVVLSVSGSDCVCIRCSSIDKTITVRWKGFELTTEEEQCLMTA